MLSRREHLRPIPGGDPILRDRHDSRDKALPTFDQDKLERLVLHVLLRAGDGLDATTLNKLFWYADAQVFDQTGRPITGARYVRHQNGPVADAIMIARAKLERDGVVRNQAGSAPDMAAFTKAEIAVLDRWIEKAPASDNSANVEASLDYAWQIAEPGEEIPMAATLAARIQKPSDDEIRWGKVVATKLALP